MIPMMVALIKQESANEEESTIEKSVEEFVAELTGKQTIYQMIRLAEEIEKRGGAARDPLEYKKMYHNLLWERIRDRISNLESGSLSPEEMLVPGSALFLEELRSLGVICYLASGTDEVYVKREADLLGITKYFEGIYGAVDQYKLFSKGIVIRQILKTHAISGHELVIFGDGYVEIQEAKNVGGFAIGVASNEKTKEGLNLWKRERLIKAGADIIVPDFRSHGFLIDHLWNSESD
jgi:phosphoglycolate phosphatase-like HAD superfamily hydrolase